MNRPSPMSDIVFYSESNSYKPFLFPLLKNLLKNNFRVIYITSDLNDSILLNPPSNLLSFYIRDGILLSLTFFYLKAKILIMTMPDLNSFHLKKSIYLVHYIYIQHSMVSSHMVYREGAFDHFDSILCSGMYQLEEIREWELLNKLPRKNLYQHGYMPLDMLLLNKKPKKTTLIHVLIAPSWGGNGLINLGAELIISKLLNAGKYVTLRLHPESKKRSVQQIKKIQKKFSNHLNFKFDNDNSVYDVLFETDVLITDWSGIALEFSFGLERPVIFIDTPRKVNNKRYKELKAIPIEVSIRNKIGVILNPKDLNKINIIVQQILLKSKSLKNKIKNIRKKNVFNYRKSVNEGSKIIEYIYQELGKK